LLGLAYPGGPEIARLAERGKPGKFKLPRPMLNSGDFNFSFSGLKTAVLTAVRGKTLTDIDRAHLAAEFQAAAVDVLVAKSLAALEKTELTQLVVAGGVGANRQLRTQLTARAERKGCQVFYPPLELCTDNGAMIALAGALRLGNGIGIEQGTNRAFDVRPRWDLEELSVAGVLSGYTRGIHLAR
jgi:N6-L-threonylcarbamoyladenine synthase